MEESSRAVTGFIETAFPWVVGWTVSQTVLLVSGIVLWVPGTPSHTEKESV